ncbi:MAG: trypsin-like peptidase domain-containing protein [Planctomycetota bacterium]|jgi:serine protease Do
MTNANDANEKCAREVLGPLFIGIGILICATIVLVFYYADEIRQAQGNRGQIEIGVLQGLGRTGRAAKRASNPTARPAAFVPPWHWKQNPDAVTGASPRAISFNQAIRIVSPSVVGINTSGERQQSASGIIVHRLGYILTNHHVIKGARNIVVTLSYDQLIKSYSAEIVDSRPDLDLAIVRINATGKEALTPAPLGDSNRTYIGQQVVAIGNPFGLSQSASAGIISNPQRTLTAGNKVFEGLIQTDASINPGSSGGALVNAKAEVIGINTAIYSPTTAFSGIGFAVPINHAKQVFRDFIEIVQSPLSKANAQAAGGNVNQIKLPTTGSNLQMMAARRGIRKCWLGIAAYPVDNLVSRGFDLPVHHGVLVNRVFDNSPAAKVGLLRGDMIYRVNDRRIRDAEMFWSYLAGGKAGDEVKITLFRKGKKRTFILKLEPEPTNVRSLLPKAPQGKLAFQTVAAATVPTGTLPSPLEQNAAGKKLIEGHWLGLEVIPLIAELTTEYQVPKGQAGVLVDEVTLESAESGILAGDMVQSINGFPTPDLEAFFRATQRVQEKERAHVGISRRGSKMTFVMTARNTNTLGFAQMEAAQPIQPGALPPHRYRGRACTYCHIFMQTGGQLPTDAGDILPNPPPITKNAKAPHRYRGQCANCHTIR